MRWIKTLDGYVREDAIIDIHKRYFGGWKIIFTLSNGTPVIYKYYEEDVEEKSEEEVDKEIDEFILFSNPSGVRV